MSHPFIEGETYKNPSNFTIMVLAIEEESPQGVWLAIFNIDPNTMAYLNSDELFIPSSEYSNWKKQEF